MSHPLATAEDLATYLNQPVTTAQAELVLDLASDAVRQAAGQQIDFGRDTIELPVSSGFLVFPQRPVVVDADNPVLVEGYPQGGWRLVPERTGLYLYELPAINVSHFARRPPQTAVVTYSHGYKPGTVPDTLKQIVLASASRHIGNPEGFASYTVGGMTATWKGHGNESFGLLTEPERQVVRRFFGGSASMLTIA